MAPTAPYDPSDLKIPLSSAQRSHMVNWLNSLPGGTGNPARLSDNNLISFYTAAYQINHPPGVQFPILNPGIGGGGIPGEGGLVGKIPHDFFSLFTSGTFWLRIGEVIVGVVIVGVGFAAVTRSALASGMPSVKVGT